MTAHPYSLVPGCMTRSCTLAQRRASYPLAQQETDRRARPARADGRSGAGSKTNPKDHMRGAGLGAVPGCGAGVGLSSEGGLI